MKKSIYMIGVAAIAMLMSSCAASWLDQEPSGSSITEAQYQQMDGVLKGSVRGIYAMMYQYGGDHDVFGQRSIDMYGDFTCGDMAMQSFSYGWFQTDEMEQSYTRRAYLWGYYYDMIRLCNKAINAVQAQVGKEDLMNEDLINENLESFYYYGQVLAMRGWCYANLQKWFCYTPDYLETQGVGLDEINSLPIYTEEVTEVDTILGNPLSTAAQVYERAEEDLKTAIYYLDKTEAKGYTRTLKQEMNSDVARLTLAYSYLNKRDWVNAAKYAEEFISNTSAKLLTQDEVLTTGFNNIASNNWVWGQDVTVETTTSLASFFGQVDVFSYSYAWAGDIKGIDQNLYESIPAWDIRAHWFNNFTDNDIKGYEYAPDGKFYSPAVKQKVGYTRKPTADEIDRDWLCDHVFMRTELGYLIAAEAECRRDNLSEAQTYLYAITDERLADPTDADGSYAAWKGTLGGKDAMLEAIRQNWRVELWGEGFGLQTFRRFAVGVTLGENHKTRANKAINPSDAASLRHFTFQIPSSEQYYNPFIRDAENMAVDE